MTSSDEKYMQMALKLAERGIGSVEPNPDGNGWKLQNFRDIPADIDDDRDIDFDDFIALMESWLYDTGWSVGDGLYNFYDYADITYQMGIPTEPPE